MIYQPQFMEADMPYFIYKVFPGRKLEAVTQFEQYREARDHARELRKQLKSEDNYSVKIIFAKNEVEAEMQLKEEREYRPLGDD